MSALKLSILIVCVLLVPTPAVSAADWPQWRGPTADGISLERDLPVQWDREHNIAWKARLPGLGTSTPIVWGDRIFVTSQIGDGPIGEGPVAGPARDFPGSPPARRGGVQERVRFAVQAFDRADGKMAWEYVFDAEGELPPTHTMHNLATPSCVTDGNVVYAWFGTGQLVALSLNGKLVWKRHLGKEYSPFFVLWGHGSSPLLYKDRLILLCDHRDASYLLALDKTTGAQLWKVDRGKDRRSYSTPVVIPSPDGRDQILVNGKERIDVYDVATGELRWYVGQAVTLAAPCPVLHDGMLYVTRGYSSGPYSAVEIGGLGDASSRVKWEIKTGAPYITSPLYYQGVMYLAGETGVVTAADAADGKSLWKARIGGIFSASPVEADGKVYLLNEDGETIVLEAGRELKILARNQLEERMLASPAISGGQIFERSDDHLICIGKATKRRPLTGGNHPLTAQGPPAHH